MHAIAAALWHWIHILNTGLYVIGIEHRVLSVGAQPFFAVHTHIRVSAQMHTDIAPEGAHPANAFAGSVPLIDHAHAVVLVSGGGSLDHDRAGQKVQQLVIDCHRPGARPATAVWGAERFVQVVVNHIEADFTRFGHPNQRIHVGSIAIHQPACGVNQIDDFFDVFLKHTERIGVGDHQAAHRLVEGCSQRL